MSEQKVIIIGAGLAGSLLAIYLGKRGIDVEVYEARPDLRRETISAGRSINLALSDRGIAALREVGMDEYMLAEAVPMYGRMIHSEVGETKLLRYSGREGEYINSVSRGGLNIALIDEAEKYSNVKIHFNERCVGFDVRTGDVSFKSGLVARGSTVIATDGAGSAVRHSMTTSLPSFTFEENWLEHGYKELHIPPLGGGGFAIEKNALHIWPRYKFMMIALPNFDGSFTCTLFISHKSRKRDTQLDNVIETKKRISSFDKPDEPAFEQLTGATELQEFFEREFPDAVPLMPTLVDDFFANPTGNLGTLKCWPWNVGGKALLLGDSAHAVVPFYGQGMNCAFEDVRVLDSLIERHGTNWETVYEEYGKLRKVNTDAIADMAEENFYEMRDATADRVFQRKRELETKLEQTYPDYFSKYSMVTFREDLPYSVAKERGNAQDRMLMEICASVDRIETLNLDLIMDRIRELS